MHNAIIHVPPSPSARRGGGLSFGRLWEMQCAFVFVFLLCGECLFGCDFISVCVRENAIVLSRGEKRVGG